MRRRGTRRHARKLVGALVALGVAALVAVPAGPAVLQWWSVRWSGAPDVAHAAVDCYRGGGRVVTSVEERPWGWVVRVVPWRVAYLGSVDTTPGPRVVYVIRVGDSDTKEAWSGGASPPTDPATGRPLSAPGARDPWEADMVLALEAGMGRAPYALHRCSDLAS